MPVSDRVISFAALLTLGILATWGALATRATLPETSDADSGPPLTSPPLTPSEALETMRVVDGINLSLAASEPMVQAPVYGTFDEDGRLWVVEMRTYMRDVAATGELVPDNRVVILEDETGDGIFDKSTVFADKLVLPRGVAPCFGGALVIEPPNLVFLRDTDGDGRADEKSVLLGGFGGRENPEHAGNGLLWGIDNWYEIAQHGVAVRFDGTKVETRKTPAIGQWGLTRDDEGRLYYVPNSNALLADVYPKHFAAMNPNRGGAAGIGELICPDSTTWPIHPTPGVNRGYLPDTLRKDRTLAKLTAACSPAFYRADALGSGFRDSVFLCEPAGNLVKRLVVRSQDGMPRADNAYQGTEFLASGDERFRPVAAVVGPDGALYILDMYRGVIQHRTYMTPYLRQQVKARGLEEPLAGGRIYRLSGSVTRETVRPRLSSATDEELVRLLSHPDGLWRDTAQRLLVQRGSKGIEHSLRALMSGTTPATTRVHGLWTLDGLGALDNLLDQDWLVELLSDEAAPVRAAAAQIASTRELRPEAGAALGRLFSDTDRHVRMLAACASYRLAPDAAPGLCAKYLRQHGGDKYERSAALSGLHRVEFPTLLELLRDSSWPQDGGQRAVLADLTDCVLRGSAEERFLLLDHAGRIKALSQDSRADSILDRVKSTMRLDSDNPKPLALSREPHALVQSAADGSETLKRVVQYLDWPGRPPVDRPKRMRDLTESERVQYARGQQLYAVCIGCHQADGRGGAGLGAPLSGSVRAQGRLDNLVRILSHGVQGSYKIGGTEYWGVMPPAPLTGDDEFAAVLTYIRRSWDNGADPVTPAQVGAIRSKLPKRSKPWTTEELDVLFK